MKTVSNFQNPDLGEHSIKSGFYFATEQNDTGSDIMGFVQSDIDGWWNPPYFDSE